MNVLFRSDNGINKYMYWASNHFYANNRKCTQICQSLLPRFVLYFSTNAISRHWWKKCQNGKIATITCINELIKTIFMVIEILKLQSTFETIRCAWQKIQLNGQ